MADGRWFSVSGWCPSTFVTKPASVVWRIVHISIVYYVILFAWFLIWIISVSITITISKFMVPQWGPKWPLPLLTFFLAVSKLMLLITLLSNHILGLDILMIFSWFGRRAQIIWKFLLIILTIFTPPLNLPVLTLQLMYHFLMLTFTWTMVRYKLTSIANPPININIYSSRLAILFTLKRLYLLA